MFISKGNITLLYSLKKIKCSMHSMLSMGFVLHDTKAHLTQMNVHTFRIYLGELNIAINPSSIL